MGFEKLGMNLAQRTASWVKTAGKSSILQTKSIQPMEFKSLKYIPKLNSSCAIDTMAMSTTTSKTVSKPVITQGTMKPIKTVMPNGTKIQKESFGILNKNGQTSQFILVKNITPLGDDSIALKYNIFDGNGRDCGYWEGLIGDLNGDSYILGFNLESNASGVGSAIKEFIKKDALANRCKNIKISAAFKSHMFHNKMGYKSAFEPEQLNSAKNVLQSIKKESTLPEFDKEINKALNSEDITEVNNLIDRILSYANTKKLWSDDIGIAELRIPMEYIL